jgi:glycosyltransferase 2 family protein
VKSSRIIQWVLGAGLAAAGLLIFFHNVNMRGLGRQIVHTSPLVIAACAALAVGSVWFRSLRWRILLPAAPEAHTKQLFPMVVIAFMINNILPARLGEAARAVLLWKRNGYGIAVSIGSLILERGIDLLVFSACFFAPVFFLPMLSPGSGLAASASVYKTVTLHTIAIVLAAGVGFVISLFIAYARFPRAVRRLGGACCMVLPEKARPRLRRIAVEIMSNLDWVFSVKKVAMVAVLSFCIVACYALMVMLLTAHRGFGFMEGLFSQAFAAIGAAIPLAPGYVGTLHAVLLQGLILCGCEREKAQAVTILFHAVPYVTVTLLGLYYFFSMHISFRDISEAEKTIEKEEKR